MPSQRIAIIIQARMSSSRLPGKVLLNLAGRPMLDHLLDGLERCGLDIVVATSTEADDLAIAEHCANRGTRCVRGPLANVADRFALAISELNCDAFVRISADSPLLDPALVDLAVEKFRQRTFDLVTNVQERTFPKGQSVEVVRSRTFLDALSTFSSAHDQEHVTPFFYANPDRFRIHNIRCDSLLGTLQTSVDTEEEMRAVEGVMEGLNKPHWEIGYLELAKLFLPLGNT